MRVFFLLFFFLYIFQGEDARAAVFLYRLKMEQWEKDLKLLKKEKAAKNRASNPSKKMATKKNDDNNSTA